MKKIIFILLFLFNIFLCSTALAEVVTCNCPNAVLINVDDGKILFDQASKERMYPASTTKIMTLILALENSNVDDKVLVNSTALNSVPSGGTTCQLKAGEEFTIDQILRGMMVASRK